MGLAAATVASLFAEMLWKRGATAEGWTEVLWRTIWQKTHERESSAGAPGLLGMA